MLLNGCDETDVIGAVLSSISLHRLSLLIISRSNCLLSHLPIKQAIFPYMWPSILSLPRLSVCPPLSNRSVCLSVCQGAAGASVPLCLTARSVCPSVREQLERLSLSV